MQQLLNLCAIASCFGDGEARRKIRIYPDIEPSFSSGRNSVPSLGTIARLAPKVITAATTTSFGLLSAPRRIGSYFRVAVRMMKFSWCGRFLRSSNQQSNGTNVSENISEPTNADVTVHAIGAKMRPSCRLQREDRNVGDDNNKHRKERRPADFGGALSIKSRTLARTVECSCSDNFRKMFSTTMTAPSTMIPKSIAPSESRLAGMPRQVSR